MRQSWSDDRLDDLNGRVDRLTDRVDAGFDRLDKKIDNSAAELRQEMKIGLRPDGPALRAHGPAL